MYSSAESRERQNSQYIVEEVGDDVINTFVHDHAGNENEKYWVPMGMVREADGHELFTFGSGPCTDLVFVSSGTKIKLGHLPYMFIDRSSFNFERTEEEDIVDGLLDELSRSSGWTLYLFALAPASETSDSKLVRDMTEKDLIDRFSSVGVKCIDMTVKEYGTYVSGLIVNPVERTIQVMHELRSSLSK